MKPVHQTFFGRPGDEMQPIGNCFPACLASVLEVDLQDVPHFYAQHQDNDAAVQAMLDWLHPRGFTIMLFDWAPWVRRYIPPGAVVILSGKSPRGEYLHAIVGEFTSAGWKMLHDPHPSGAGIDGEPTLVEIVMPLMRSAA